ncbi:MAG TPA: NAD(P)-binding domain-containing protein, partial [Acidimicrobiales bacterium]|nr:NAD(P)-binding domain-containing protein [Acidimicrobiales bacterium]
MTARLAVVGGGKMGGALVEGLLRAGWARPEDLVVVEPVAARREELAAAHEGLRVDADVPNAEGAVLAV